MLISEGLEMLEVPQPGGFIYPVLLFDDNGMMLVDTGYPKQEDLFLSIVEDAGYKLDAITHILITHHDLDHIGGLRALHDEFPSIQILAHQDEIPFIDGSVESLKIQDMERDFDTLPENKKTFLQRMKVFFPQLVCNVDFALHDRDVLDIAGGVDVIFTPGHTLGHICLYHRGSKTLIAGDALNLDTNKLIGANPEYTHDIAMAKASIQQLSDFDIERIITYHGGIFLQDANAAIKSLNH